MIAFDKSIFGDHIPLCTIYIHYIQDHGQGIVSGQAHAIIFYVVGVMHFSKQIDELYCVL